MFDCSVAESNGVTRYSNEVREEVVPLRIILTVVSPQEEFLCKEKVSTTADRPISTQSRLDGHI